MTTSENSIRTNGFFVDRKTGECSKEDYFIDDGFSIKSRDFNRFNIKKGFKGMYRIPSRIHLEERMEKRLQYIESDIGIYIFRKMNSLLNCLNDFINPIQRKKLFDYISGKKPKSINSMYMSVIEYIIIHDLPITTGKIINLIANDLNSDRFKFYQHQIRSIKTIRKYYWLILKKLYNIPYLSDMKRIKFYKSIKQYYDLIRFKMAVACDPTHLIGFLIYETLNQYCVNIPKKHRTHKKLGTSYFFKLGHKNQLELIKKRKFDRNIELKLNF